MEKHIIEIGGVHVLEPGTFISDIILGFASLYFFYVLTRISETKLQKQFTYFFLFLGLSSFVGAFAHGFYLYAGKSLHFATWMLTGIAIYYFEYGISGNFKTEKKRKVFIALIRAQLAIYVVITTILMNFIAVKINTAIGLLGVAFPVMAYHLFKDKKINNLYIMSGIVLAIIPALFHKAKFSVIAIFNMNDLSHFFLVVCLFLIFIGFYKDYLKERLDLKEITK